MADRARCIATAILCFTSACFELDFGGHPGPSRRLDEVCSTKEGCTTAGDAQRTRGPTDDTVGFILRAGGSVRIVGTVNQVLVRGTGHFSAVCAQCGDHSSATPSDDTWIDVIEHADATS